MAGLAAMREVEPCRERRVQYRTVRGHANAAAVGLYADGVLRFCHVWSNEGESRGQASQNWGAGRTVSGRGPNICLQREGNHVFANPPADQITQLMRSARTIAVVGLSADPTRPSHGVARALQRFGYRIIPVTPTAEVILGEHAVPDLDHLREALEPGERVDIVDVFRRPEHVPAIVDDCIRLKLPALWLQDGVIDEKAAERARQAGIFTVMDRCLYRDRAALR